MVICFSVACAWLVQGSLAFGQSADDIFGTWRHPENGSLIEIYRCGSGACAKVIKVKDPSRKDIHNPNPALRNRPIVGIVIAKGARKTGSNKWVANLYDTLDGNTYRGSITVLNKNQVTLVGCGFGNLICEAVTWSRVKPQVPERREGK